MRKELITVYILLDLKLSGEVVYSGEVEVLADSIPAGFVFEVRLSSSSYSLCLMSRRPACSSLSG